MGTKNQFDAFLKNQKQFYNSSFDKSFPNKSSQKIYKKYLKSFLKLKDSKHILL
jgi:hypothetical protein